MPLGGFCEVCDRWVWLTPYGACENGHPPTKVRDVPAAQGEHVGGRRALRGRLRAVLAGQGALSLLVAPLAVDRLDLHARLLQLAGVRLHRHPRPAPGLDDRRLRLPRAAHPHARLDRYAPVSRARRLSVLRLGGLGRPRALPASLLPRPDVRRRAAHLAAGAAPRTHACCRPPSARRCRAASTTRRARSSSPPAARSTPCAPRPARSPSARCRTRSCSSAATADQNPQRARHQATQGRCRAQLPDLLLRRRAAHRQRLRPSSRRGPRPRPTSRAPWRAPKPRSTACRQPSTGSSTACSKTACSTSKARSSCSRRRSTWTTITARPADWRPRSETIGNGRRHGRRPRRARV